MYITIEGPIGVGKSSLARLIKQEFQFEVVNEIITENPFLERFYQDQDKWSFQTEMYFLTHRYLQLRSLSKLIDAGDNFVADYDIYKNTIFAKKNLTTTEFNKFLEIYQYFKSDLRQNDLTIFLSANLETLRARIKLRNRSFEQEIEDEYLLYLIDAYNQFSKKLAKERPDSFLVIECDNLDYVHNNNDRKLICQQIKQQIERINNEI